MNQPTQTSRSTTRPQRIALTVLTLLGTSFGLAGKYEDQVRDALSRVYNNVPSSYSRLSDLRDMGTLDDGRSATVSYTLNSGYTYQLIGVCDNDCSDLDLELRDENNNLIDEDSEDDDNPIVTVTPRYRGKFTLKVMMRDCASNSGCVYGVDVYRK